MEHFLIVTNDGKDADGRVTAKVKQLLTDAGKTCVLCEKDGDKKIIREKIPEKIDCAVVIGGDGSLIEVARFLHGRNIPVLGINMGRLGYLTEVEVNHIEDAFAQIFEGDYTLEDRMMLEGTLQDGRKDISLNDIVVSRKTEIRLIHFRIYVNGELLNTYEADGVIISTPTGSTAYNLSAGGPIVEPTASMIVITPICPHALNTSSIVLSAEDEIVIEIAEGRHDAVEEAMVAFDGADTLPLVTGDRVTIRRAGASTRLMRLSRISFLEMLRRKMKGN